MANKLQGDRYEKFTKSHLLKTYDQVYLWSEIPIEVFATTNIFKCYGEKRLFIKSFMDKGIVDDRG